MTSVHNMGTGELMGIYWYIKEKKGNRYLVKVIQENGKRKEIWLGNVEEIEKIITEYKKHNKRPYNRSRGKGAEPLVADPGGFEPPTTGLGGRRSVLAELRVHPRIFSIVGCTSFKS